MGDRDEAARWYQRLFGRPAHMLPNDAEAAWQLSDSASLYLLADPGRAGQGVITLVVDELDAQVAEIAAGGRRKCEIRDPDGNSVSLRQEPDGSLVTHADLSGISAICNEIVVDGRGNTYVNGDDLVTLIPADGEPRRVADGISFGNGMAVTADNGTLIVAESHGNCLTAFDIAQDGSLSGRRTWADLDGGFPDGICVDAEGAVWYADVPNKRCVRVAEGGAVLEVVKVDRGCFACMLGGPDGRTLYIVAAQWRGMDKIDDQARTGQVLTARAPAAAAGWPSSG